MEEKKWLPYAVVIGVLVIAFGLICGISRLVSPDYKKGKYTMVYKVYYNNNTARTYTITNDYPIAVESSRGTNWVATVKEGTFPPGTFWSSTVFQTNAPIEVVSYTFQN
jgi:hypothetical protein